jgi:2'-5' RNA ligase
MPFAVQLDLDAATNSRLNEIAEKLGRTPGLSTVNQLGDVHHISLGVYDSVPVEQFTAELARFAEAVTLHSVRLAAIGVFVGARSVVYITPVATEEMLALHRRYHQAVAAFSSECWPVYLPGAWVPHVTMAMEVEPDALGWVVAALRDVWQPSDAYLDAVRLVRFLPVETLHHFKLDPGPSE